MSIETSLGSSPSTFEDVLFEGAIIPRVSFCVPWTIETGAKWGRIIFSPFSHTPNKRSGTVLNLSDLPPRFIHTCYRILGNRTAGINEQAVWTLPIVCVRHTVRF